MKNDKRKLLLNLLVVSVLLVSCSSRSSDQMLNDTRSCGRHVQRGFCCLGGKQGDSKQIRSRQQFEAQCDPCHAYADKDYIPLADVEYNDEIAMADFVTRQPKESPGDPGSAIPGIESFRDPNTMPEVRSIFTNVQFPFDSDLIKGQDNLEKVRSIAGYMRQNPNVYVFVEGHCDERGPQAYNLALGARRSNAVRNMLIKEGVNPDNIFTISYGKERPLVMGHNEAAWAQNRRAEFKVYYR
ncbi:MAG: OmpA family protein [Chlamydiales bacterium]|nr:OmpA family protein [Chlamydiia bacterium]MCP5507873.1 OmpA family protein [Chlamydiales bacterium]